MKVVWYWAGDSGPQGHQDVWIKYAPEVATKLEKAFQSGEKELSLDAERYVELKTKKNEFMLQRRRDDPSKRRNVKREEVEESDSEEEEEEEAKWFWKGDKGNWVEYSSQISGELEKAFKGGKGDGKVKVDQERFVDVTDPKKMFQARFDNPAQRRRDVKREEMAKKPSKKRKPGGDHDDVKKPKKDDTPVPAITTSSTEVWEEQPQIPPSDVNQQHLKEHELYNKYLANPDSRGNCNTLIQGPKAIGYCPNDPNHFWNLWKCIRCGYVNTTASCANPSRKTAGNCNWVHWGWICLDHRRNN